jgi:adenylate kinase family enzyme
MKKLIILMGSIGAGKTTICNELVKLGFVHLGIDHFYPKSKRDPTIKKFWEDKKYVDQAYHLLFESIQDNIKKNHIVVETTGGIQQAVDMSNKLNTRYKIFIKVPIKILKERIRKRNASDYTIKSKLLNVNATIKNIKELKPQINYTLNGNQETDKILEEILKIIK